MADLYDVAIIGGGPGGYVAAIRSAQLGMKVALIEKRQTLGGTCLNIGCIPSKALLRSSELFFEARHGFKNHGIQFDNMTVDLKIMQHRKQQVVNQLTRGVAGLLKKNGVKVFHGEGRLLSANEIEVGKEIIKSSNIVLATGSSPVELPFLKFDHQKILDSTDALELENVPERLVVIGGGVIGLELGSVWSRLGSKVTVVELLPEILPGWDLQVAKALKRELKKQGIDFLTDTKVVGAGSKKTGPVAVNIESKDGKKSTLEADKVLVAVGRKPYTDSLGLETVGVRVDDVSIFGSEKYRTNIPNIYAIGDIIAGPMLAHKAEDEGFAIAEILAGKPGRVNYDVIPGIVYTWPEAASVGKTEEQLKEEGVEYSKGQFQFTANGRALAQDDPGGFVKVLSHKKTDRVLGVHAVSPQASGIIAEAVAVMEFGGSAEDIGRTIHAHPTHSEALKEAAMGAWDKMIHGG